MGTYRNSMKYMQDSEIRLDECCRSVFQAVERKGHILCFQKFLDRNSNIMYFEDPYDSAMLIHIAVDYDYIEYVEELLKRGMDMNVECSIGNPLSLAIRRGHLKIAKLLLSYGANPFLTLKGERDSIYEWMNDELKEYVDEIIKIQKEPNIF